MHTIGKNRHEQKSPGYSYHHFVSNRSQCSLLNAFVMNVHLERHCATFLLYGCSVCLLRAGSAPTQCQGRQKLPSLAKIAWVCLSAVKTETVTIRSKANKTCGFMEHIKYWQFLCVYSCVSRCNFCRDYTGVVKKNAKSCFPWE